MKNDTKKAAVIIGGIIIAAIALLAIKGALVGRDAGGSSEASTAAPIADGVQEVTLRLDPKTLDYQPNPIRVKAGVPVRMTVDLDSVKGCTAAVSMPAFGVRKRAVPGDNIIEFTPTERGTFPFSCAMGMSHGVVVVE
jgi:plastocyanin domain-containing protein